MRLDGDDMVVGIKDAAKLTGISIITFCAVLVCTMFLNYHMDIVGIRKEIVTEPMMNFYEAQVSTAKVVCMVSGGCLLITSMIMLVFYIKHYIDTHKKELGILKALGYSNLRIAKYFWVFGISVLIGTMFGFGGAFLIMPSFYDVQNESKILPEIPVRFHPILFLWLVAVPTVVFSLFAVGYACYRLDKPVMTLLKENLQEPAKEHKHKPDKDIEGSFIGDLRRSTLVRKKTLVFFILFASFCFSAMTQMSAGMKDLASIMMGAMIMLIGLVLAFTTLFLAITTVIKGNAKTIAMLRVFGYSQKECCRAILGGYRPFAYMGFVLGTGYQYGLLRIMVDIVFRDVEGTPAYKFDVSVMLVSLAVFIALYEIVMRIYSGKIRKISIKEIMLE